MKNIELLFPDFCNIYGESYNVEYLRRSCKDINVIETGHKMEPAFVKDKVDMIYLGCTTEKKQEQIIDILRPYRNRIIELINDGTIFLVTGNSIEIFGNAILEGRKLSPRSGIDGRRVIPALEIFDFYSVRYMDRERHNSQYVGTFTPKELNENPITMLGHKSQFSFAYRSKDGSNYDTDSGFEYENNSGTDFDPFVDLEIGIGMNKGTKLEGIRKNNFFATYSLGPYFILNPLFAKYILRKMGLDDSLAFELEIMEAYEYRLHELRENLG